METCGSGKEALASAPRFAPDLILLDVIMQDMDGPKTLRAIREQDNISAIPVIFLTANAQPDEIAEYRALGALDVIVKPFDPMTLADRIREVWERWHAKGPQA